MFRLTREVRLAVSPNPDNPPAAGPHNGHAGYPPLNGLGCFLTVQVSLQGEPDSASGYLVNIKEIDETVRRDGLPLLMEYAGQRPSAVAEAVLRLFNRLRKTWPALERLQVAASPFTSYSVLAEDLPMVRFSQKFEFSAAHRLHNPELSPAANRELFGKCNNPHGHGHNYELQVTLRGKPDNQGQLLPVHQFEEIVIKTVIDRLDHKFLNIEVPEFAQLNPTVENIAATIYQLLRPKLEVAGADLAAVTVWETPKTWCEYTEERNETKRQRDVETK
jgi:6-pyruvoyltetrahydropterin/6-carboxytetrahydropterin synthase